MKSVNSCLNDGTVIDLLRDEYARIWKLCAKYQAALENDSASERARVVHELCPLVTICSLVEQEVFYPEVRKVDHELVLDLIVAHDDIAGCIMELRTLQPEDMDYDLEVLRLIDIVHDHIRLSERMMLPLIEREIPASRLQPLAVDFVHRKRLLETFATGKSAPHVTAAPGAPRLMQPSITGHGEHRAAA